MRELHEVYKPSPERGTQCTKSGFAHWRGCLRGGLHTARKRRLGLCALEGLFGRGFVQCHAVPVYKLPSKRGHQCTKPAWSRSAVYKVPPEQGPQCTKSGFAHWESRSAWSLYSGVSSVVACMVSKRHALGSTGCGKRGRRGVIVPQRHALAATVRQKGPYV